MANIKIPATPRSAYDPKRQANALLLSHVRELEKAVSAKGRKVVRKYPKTEEQVAAYMRHLNRALHQQIVLPEIKRRPLDVPTAGQRKRRPQPLRARARKRTGRR